MIFLFAVANCDRKDLFSGWVRPSAWGAARVSFVFHHIRSAHRSQRRLLMTPMMAG